MDKFGRHLDSKTKNLPGLPGVGFKLTADGDYDIQTERLRYIGEPNDTYDAVTKDYADQNWLLFDNEDDAFNVREKPIRTLMSPDL